MGPVKLEPRCGECLLYGAVQGMVDGLVLLDLEGRIWEINRKARDLLNIGSRQVEGTLFEVQVRNRGLAAFYESAESEDVPVTADLPFPPNLTIQATLSTCLSASREPIGRMLLLRDVTRQKKIQIELSTSVAKRLVEMAGDDASNGDPLPLTKREREILSLLVDGLTNAQISERLEVSLNTIASHLKHIYPKLKVNSRAQAAALAVTHGLRPAGR